MRIPECLPSSPRVDCGGMWVRKWRVAGMLAMTMLWTACQVGPRRAAPSVTTWRLAPDAVWALQPPTPERFDASGLLRLPDGRWLTVNDKQPALWEMDLSKAGVAPVKRCPDIAPADAADAGGLGPPFDLEGIARDDQGRIYLCDELQRRVLRWDGARWQALPIDWDLAKRWFSRSDPNASFEGIAVGGGRVYVANERDTGRILVIDPETWRVIDDFRVAPPGVTRRDVHFTDLCWFDGELWVLCREERRVLRVDPGTRTVLAAFSYFDVEMKPEFAYRHALPYGFFEGLSVDREHIWLLVDNNGFGRRKDAADIRPQLFRCPRPDR
jgi:hypothetical protein